MKQINWSRVLIGGLLAGLVINAFEFILNMVIMQEQWQNAMRNLGQQFPKHTTALAIWVVWAFMIGLFLSWLYAAIRPRVGPGIRTAVTVGAFVWACDCLVPAIAFWNLGLLPISMLLILTAWALPEHIIAAIAGAWIYREDDLPRETSS